MAEGIARSLAPPGVKVWSAGSRPATVRPEAIAVLREIDIEIAGHRSKEVGVIPADEVDLVVTLCAEEECPLFLGRARRLHWGLPDPAAVSGSEDERRTAFRQIRDELRRRMGTLFIGAGTVTASGRASRAPLRRRRRGHPFTRTARVAGSRTDQRALRVRFARS